MRLAVLVVSSCAACGGASRDTPDAPTFNRDVAPIVFESCAPCHRRGGPAPFALLDYAAVRRRAREIVEVTRDRFMPPWLPEPGHGDFRDERRLSDDEIETLRAWHEAGRHEGDPADLPAPPAFTEGWRLGEPDLVVTLDGSFTVPAGGEDVFRNFGIPVPVEGRRFVRTVELRPGNARVVHHAVMRVDRTGSARSRDLEDAAPGFDGMDFGYAEAPDGQLLGWTPGRVPFEGREDVAWRVDPATDIVLQLHMLPSGKPEPIRPSIGLHFAERPPTRTVWGLTLHAEGIDIPPGEDDHVVEERFTLPVPVEVLSVYPHAHYVGKRVEGHALLPDGTRRSMIRIDDWDFNWQDEYRYRKPVDLPRGATLVMRWSYDNSDGNPRNPNSPPQRVVSGNRSSDEMGTLSFEILTRERADLLPLNAELARYELRKAPNNWYALHTLGVTSHLQGQPTEAVRFLRRALELNPAFAEAHYHLGIVLQTGGRLDEAATRYREALRLRPDDPDAHYNLALALQSLGRPAEASGHYRESLRLRPDDAEAHNNLGNLLLQQGAIDEAVEHYREALRIRPDYDDARRNLERARR